MFLFGLPHDSPAIQSALSNWGIGLAHEPDYPDVYQHFDYHSFKELGLRFVFGDEAFYRGSSETLHHKALVLTNLLYYSGDDYYNHDRFDGPLPYELTWVDTREQVWKKLGAPNWQFAQANENAVVERWDFSLDTDQAHWVLVFYVEDEQSIKLIQLGWAPQRVQPEPTLVDKRKPPLRFEALAPLLHKPWNAPAVHQQLAALPIQAAIDECGKDCAEVDAVIEDGIELYFDEANMQDRKDADGEVFRFTGLRFFRYGDSGSRGFKGQLPSGLKFADRPEQVIAKVGVPPTAGDADEFSGYYVWNLPDYLLHVMFSVQEQRVDRVTVIAHGYYEPDLLE